MAYQITLVDRARREAQIARSVEASAGTEDFWEFRATKTALPVIRIPVDLPIYRMENFRTFSEQAEYIAREHRSHDLFVVGQESESVQQIQHEILARLAAKGKAASVTPVIDVLQREKQRETLLVTRGGVVVNGNRRLAAMRELWIADKLEFDSFGYIDCKVLPADTTPSDILEIEAALQAKPETRLDYDWIGDAKLLAAMLKIKGRVEDVAGMLGRRVAEVKTTLQALNEADIYLKDWVGAEGEYSRVSEHGEQLFKDLPSLIQGKPEALQEASRSVAWSLFENVGKLEGRLYNYNSVFGKRVEDVLDRLAEELGVAVVEEPRADGEEFDFELDGGPSQASYQPLIDALKDQSTRAEAVDLLVEIAVSVVESEKDKKSGGAALKAITSANAKLAEVDLSRAAPDTYVAAERQLSSVMKRATELQEKLSESRKG